ncbi:MAG: BatA domain-containing protein [Planctomycetes bacterium]|nr:BatA domain-containing protein [Planctomycetota bacterium]
MIHPWLLGLGAALMSVPIIIHLLNKRKFKIVDWAAMEFLLDAERRNRRRIRLENLILLLLRCLAILLLGFLVARPFLSRSITAGWVDAPRFERIVLLDDSLSMEVRSGNQSALEAAKESVHQLVDSLVESSADETFTLFVMSDPREPLLNAKRVNAKSIAEIKGVVDGVMITDKPVKLEDALGRLEKHIGGGTSTVNRVIYVYSDLRQRDWEGDAQNPDTAPDKVLARLSERATCFLADIGSEEDSNLVVTSIRPEDRLIAGRVNGCRVVVANTGSNSIDDVKVKFFVGDSLSQEQHVGKMAAGEVKTLDFDLTFSTKGFDNLFAGSRGGDVAGRQPSKSVKVRAEVSSGLQRKADRLQADSTRFMAARVVRGVPVLVIDGDPTGFHRTSESFYLKRALMPPGRESSGIVAEVRLDTELEKLQLDNYKLIFLCNVYHLPDAQIARLERFVRAGNGLVIFPGDQTDPVQYNQSFYNEGKAGSFIEHFAEEGATSITKSEFCDPKRFAILDRNSEGESRGVLEGDEVAAWMTPFDKNYDGVISREELTGEAVFKEIADVFKNIGIETKNSNSKDSISEAEVEMWMKKEALSPFKLIDYGGGESDRIWAQFHFGEQTEDLLREIFQNQESGLFGHVKVFRFWQAMVDPRLKQPFIDVRARFVLKPDELPHEGPITPADFEIDPDNAPAIVEKYLGKGRVVAMTFPADKQWTNLTDEPAFLVLVNELVSHAARTDMNSNDKQVGEPLEDTVNLVDYKPGAKLRLPGTDTRDIQAAHRLPGRSQYDNRRQFKFFDTDRRGFYELELKLAGANANDTDPENDVTEIRLFAMNIDASEGSLRRVDVSALSDSFADTNVTLVSGAEVANQDVEGSKIEIWKLILIVAAIVLCLEQFLGWLFGSRR